MLFSCKVLSTLVASTLLDPVLDHSLLRQGSFQVYAYWNRILNYLGLTTRWTLEIVLWNWEMHPNVKCRLRFISSPERENAPGNLITNLKKHNKEKREVGFYLLVLLWCCLTLDTPPSSFPRQKALVFCGTGICHFVIFWNSTADPCICNSGQFMILLICVWFWSCFCSFVPGSGHASASYDHLVSNLDNFGSNGVEAGVYDWQ